MRALCRLVSLSSTCRFSYVARGVPNIVALGAGGRGGGLDEVVYPSLVTEGEIRRKH